MKRFTNHFAEMLNTTAKCIWIGSGSMSSVFMDFEQQGEAACKQLEDDPDFQGEFSVVGNSQGGLIARYVVEKCKYLKGKVRNFVSFGGPHMGVGKLPHCFNGFICNFINYIIDWGVYWSFFQHHVGPAGYFRDPKQLEFYKSHSIFLPSVNNEVSFDKQAYDNFSSLNRVFLGMFAQDTMIYPAETAWFHELMADGSIKPFNETDLYLNDLIGLRKLVEEDRVVFHRFPGDHLQFSYADIDEFVIPVLKA
jgi:palmitoyl-protein thioesterase